MHNESKELCGSGVLLGHMLYRNARCVAGEYSLAFNVHSATNFLLLLPVQPIMHGWGVLPGRMEESKDNNCMAGEYSPAGCIVRAGGTCGWGVIPGDSRIRMAGEYSPAGCAGAKCVAGEYSPAIASLGHYDPATS